MSTKCGSKSCCNCLCLFVLSVLIGIITGVGAFFGIISNVLAVIPIIIAIALFILVFLLALLILCATADRGVACDDFGGKQNSICRLVCKLAKCLFFAIFAVIVISVIILSLGICGCIIGIFLIPILSTFFFFMLFLFWCLVWNIIKIVCPCEC